LHDYSFRTSFGQFSKAVKYAHSATDKTERNYRNCVLFDIKPDYQCIVGTDSRRLNYSDIQGVMCFDASDGKPCEFKALINAELANKIAKIKADYSAQCDFGIRRVTSETGTDTDYFAWVIDQTEGFCRIVDTVYPAWTEVTSGTYHGSLEVKADELSKAINLLKPILKAGDSRDIVKLSGNGTLYVSATAESEGSGRIWLDTDHADGPDMLVGLNYKYLQAVLKSHKGQIVSIRYGNELSPIAVRANGNTSQSAILMPVKLPE
jgi:DNA polymerase III sliding clamp (beta) subunit (PCNA family)